MSKLEKELQRLRAERPPEPPKPPTPLVMPRKKKKTTRAPGPIAKREQLNLTVNAARAQLNRLYVKQRGLCYWCGLPMARDQATREHLYPLAKFETRIVANQDWNIRAVHEGCNR